MTIKPRNFQILFTILSLGLVITSAFVFFVVAYQLGANSLKKEVMRTVGVAADGKVSGLLNRLNMQKHMLDSLLAGEVARCENGNPKQFESCLKRSLTQFLQIQKVRAVYLETSNPKTILQLGEPSRELVFDPSLNGGQLARFYHGGESNPSYLVQSETLNHHNRIVVEISATNLDLIFSVGNPGINGESFLVDPKGFFLTTNKFRVESGIKHPIDAKPMVMCLGGKSGETMGLDYSGRPIIHGFRYIPEIGGGCIMFHIDQRDAFAELNTFTREWWVVSLILCVVLGAASYPISRKLADQLQKNLDEVEKAGRQVLESENKYRQIFSASRAASLLVDMETGILFDANDAACNFYGYTKNEMLSKTIHEINTLTPLEINAEMEAAKTGKRSYFFHRHRLSSGKVRDVEVYPSPLTSGGKTLTYLIVHDITDRKHAESELLKMKNAIEQSANMVVITNRDGIIEYVNPAFEGSTLYSFEEVVGKTPRALRSGKHPGEFFRNMWETILRGEVWHDRVINRKKNGELYTDDMTITPIRDGKGAITHFVAIKMDVTKQIEAEGAMKLAHEELKNTLAVAAELTMETSKAKERAEAALEMAEEAKNMAEHFAKEADNANKTKSEFLANMSHEIRTPMNAILGFTELLGRLITDAKQREYIKAITASGKSLLTLINDILDLSKVEAGKLTLEYEVVDPHSIFHDMEKIFSKAVSDKGLEFHSEVDPALPDALILDETRLRQVLLNLVGNAIKFTDTGYVKLHAGSKSPPAECRGKVDLFISIEDTGIGIPKDQQNRIFDAFSQQAGQSHKKYGGTGLGLAITTRLVDLMNGTIELESELGKGSIFKITLRDIEISTISAIKEDQEALKLASLKFKKTTVLVVDDVRMNRNLISGFLDQPEFTIVEAADGKEAIEVAKTIKPGVILMDLRMPIMGGEEATRIMKADEGLKDIPIIAVTASVLKEREDEIIGTFDGYLRKPVTRAKLLSVLTNCIETSTLSEETASSGPEMAGATAGFSGMTAEIIDTLPELVKELEGNFASRLKSVAATMTMHDIEDFGKALNTLAAKYGCRPLAAYSGTLLHQADMFDIDGLKKTFNGFPAVIASIKRHLNAN